METIYPCSKKSNCVSSKEKLTSKNYIRPFEFNLAKEQILSHIIYICVIKLNAKLIKKTNNYLHFVFTTPIFRFKDDVEFQITKDKIHIKSSSRIGEYDFGKNNRRIKKISKLFEKNNFIK